MKTLPVAFSTLACPDWPWSRVLERGAAYGYDGVEIRMLERDTDLLGRPEFSPGALDQRRRELEAARFRVCGLASSVRFDAADRDERARQLAIGARYLELARELGASFVRVFGDVLPPPGEAAARAATLAAIADGLDRMGERGAALSVDVLIETHGDFCDSRLMHELFQRVAHPHVGILWDTHHPWRFYGESLAETWARIGNRVRHTHWKDSVAAVPRQHSAAEAQAEAEARRLMAGHRAADYVLFGDGEFPAAECRGLLSAAGYTGWLSYEWEKAWHPEIAPAEAALPPFPERIRKLG